MTPHCLTGALSLALALSGAQDDPRTAPALPLTPASSCCAASTLAPAPAVADAAGRAALVALAPVAEERGYIGISMEMADDGMRIVGLFPGGPAEQAGLREGDVVLRIGKVATDGDEDAVMEALGKLQAGEKVTVRVRRGEETLKKKLTLATLASLQGEDVADAPRTETVEVAELEPSDAPVAVRLRQARPESGEGDVVFFGGRADAPEAQDARENVRVFRFGGEGDGDELEQKVRAKVRELKGGAGGSFEVVEGDAHELHGGTFEIVLQGEDSGDGLVWVQEGGDGPDDEVHEHLRALGYVGDGEVADHDEDEGHVQRRFRVVRPGGDGEHEVHLRIGGEGHDVDLEEIHEHLMELHGGEHGNVHVEILGDGEHGLDEIHEHLMELHGAHGGDHGPIRVEVHGGGAHDVHEIHGDGEHRVEVITVHGGPGMGAHGAHGAHGAQDAPKVRGRAKVVIVQDDGEPQVMEFELDGDDLVHGLHGIEGLEGMFERIELDDLDIDFDFDAAHVGAWTAHPGHGGDFVFEVADGEEGHGAFEGEGFHVFFGEMDDDDHGDGPHRIRMVAPRAPRAPRAPAAPRGAFGFRSAAPQAPPMGELRQELRSLREEIQALRDEVRSLRRELNGRGGDEPRVRVRRR